MSPKIHGLLGTLKNKVGNYYSFLDKTDSALLCYSEAYQEIRQSEMEHKIPDIYINIAYIYIPGKELTISEPATFAKLFS